MYDSTGTLIGVLGIGRDITEHKRAEEVLRQNQLQLANALDLAHIVNWEFDVADRMFTFDDRFYSFFGTTAEREGGHRISAETYAREFVHPDDISTVAEEIRKILETRDPLYRGQMEHRIIRRGGEIRTIIARYAPVMDAQGRVIRTFGANQDITERKVMEDALLESRQIFADIISFLPDPTFVIDAEGKVLAWNRALEQLSGVPAAEIVGKGDYEYSLWMDGKRRPILINLVQDPDKDYGRVDYRGIIEEGHTIMAETDVIHSGKKITLSLVASPLLDQDGKIIGAIESMRDITRIKETEAELARINAHLETLVKERTHALEEEVIQRRNAEQKVKDTLRHTRNVIEANPDLMVILDAKGILQDVNATTEQMTGLPREKLIGTSYNLYLIANNDAETNFARLLR
jgi:PAS domain S-box-containing protein